MAWFQLWLFKLYLLLIFINLFIICVNSNNVFDLNLDNVNHVYHRAAVMTLLKARASTLLNSETVTYTDRVFYKRCSQNAMTPVSLAKCVVNLLDQTNSEFHEQQKDSPTAIEKITQFLFGNQYLNSPNNFNDGEKSLRRIIPVNKNFEAEKYYKTTTSLPDTMAPIAAKEFYSTNAIENADDSFYQGAKFGLKPYPVRIRPLNKAKSNYYPGRSLLRRRLKREMKRPKLHDSESFSGLSNLAKLEKYHQMLSHCEAYMKKLNDENSRYIDSNSKLPFKFELKKDKNMTVIENVFEALGSAMGSTKMGNKFSFMSPRLFSILPTDDDKRKHLLSPTLFSFHEKDGFFPLPDVLKKFNVQNGAEKEWLETLLEISGASNTIEKLVKNMEPQMKEMNDKIYPDVLELERIEENWRIVMQSYTNDQRNDIKERGYAFLEPEQMQLLYSRGTSSKLNIDFNEYAMLTKEERQKRIDDDIRNLAKMNLNIEQEKFFKYKKRRRRQVVHPNGEITTNTAGEDYSQEATHEPHNDHGPIHFITLEPWAFGSKIGHGAALEAITLSPHAFFTEVLMPEALILQTLGPRAFIPSILSPNALVGRILSPAAFRAEVLSPRALTAFILTPEALIAEVLSPKFLELRVLSPEALIIQVLSPSIIAPRILSPEAGALLILSPNILSPRVLSEHSLTVEVLSPHILGGGHDEHEDHAEGKEHHHKPDENVDVEHLLGQGEHGDAHQAIPDEHGNTHEVQGQPGNAHQQITTNDHDGHQNGLDSHNTNHDEHESLIHVIP